MVERLRGKTAVLTGATGGIGQVIARRYLEENAIMILTGRNSDKLTKIQLSLQLEFPSSKIHLVIMDVSSLNSVINGVKEIVSKVGNIDILINNAGSAGPKCSIANIPLDSLDTNTESLGSALGSLLGGP